LTYFIIRYVHIVHQHNTLKGRKNNNKKQPQKFIHTVQQYKVTDRRSTISVIITRQNKQIIPHKVGFQFETNSQHIFNSI